MAKNTSVLLGEHNENFNRDFIESGKFSAESKVERTELRIFEQGAKKSNSLVSELIKGENSEPIRDFDRNKNLQELRNTYLK